MMGFWATVAVGVMFFGGLVVVGSLSDGPAAVRVLCTMGGFGLGMTYALWNIRDQVRERMREQRRP
jgi:hypothetical protein